MVVFITLHHELYRQYASVINTEGQLKKAYKNISFISFMKFPEIQHSLQRTE